MDVLLQHVDAALRAGLPLGRACRAVARVWRMDAEESRVGSALAATFAGRLGLVACVALSVRIGLMHGPALRGEGDATALAFAAALAAAGQFGVRRALTGPWLTEAVAAQLLFDFAGVPFASAGAPARAWATELRQLGQRELRAGASLADARYALLERHGHLAVQARRARRLRVAEALPLLELLTVGVPAALLLLVPLLEAIG